MTASEPLNRADVLLSVQRALRDMIGPDVRGIAVSYGHNLIRARFVYDHAVDETAREIVSEVETEVLADFRPEVRTEFLAEHLPIGRLRQGRDDETWVHLRRETCQRSDAVLRPESNQRQVRDGSLLDG